MWIVYEVSGSNTGSLSFHTIGHFDTKREAHTAVLNGLKGKHGNILRQGHTYTYLKPRK
jgi:hypothetical protein